MLELSGALGLAQEPVHVLCLGEAATAGHLDSHDAIEFGIARLVDGAEGADPELFEEFELAQAFGGLLGQPTGSAAGIELDARAARRADDFAGRFALNDNRALAMRALEGHSRDLVVPTEKTRAFCPPNI
jgi:hypothetical protein